MGADAAIKLSVDVNGADGEDRSPDKQAIRDILDITDGMGAGLIVIATSNPVAVGFAQKIASKNSRINIFAGMTNENKRLSFDANWLHYNQITITGSFSCTPNMLRQAAKLASNRRINLSKIVTHRYSLAEIKEAIMATEKYSGLRVVINDF
jgi:L-iditol 2-dehydrogenase